MVLFLISLWIPMSSHAFMERADWIHQEATEQDSDHHHDHDGADGICVRTASHIEVPQPDFGGWVTPLAAAEFWYAASAVVDSEAAEANGPAPPGAAPPELSQTWHFSYRTALPARAPSYLS